MQVATLCKTLLFALLTALTVPGSARVLDENCNGCHGPDGVSEAPYMPTIAGLNFRYFYAAMQGFKKERRRSTIMGRIAKGYKTSQLQTMALHYGKQSWTEKLGAADSELAKRGQELHVQYCEKCHKDGGRFQDKETPPLAGQAKGYLLLMMHDYQKAATIMPQPPLMQERLEKLGEQDLTALSEYYASGLVDEGLPPDQESSDSTLK